MADVGSKDIALIGNCLVLPNTGGTIFVGRTGALVFSAAGVGTFNAIPALPGTSTGTILRSDGTNYVASTLTMPDTAAISRLLYASAANVISALATANSSVLVTSAGGVPSLATDIPTAVTIGTGYIYRVGGTDVAVADGGTGLSSTTINQILYSSATSTIAGLATANSSVLVTSATGVPSLSTTLPALARIASINSDAVVLNKRTRVTLAQINAGLTLLAAVSGFKYRMIACTAIAIGGAAGGLTTVDVKGTQSAGAAILVSYAQASLTQSTVLKDGGAGATVLANGASYIQNDANTAITVIKAGADLTVATDIDINLTYALEA